MDKKGLRILVVVAALLVAVIAAFVIVDSTGSESNYRNVLVEVDSADLTRFSIMGKGKKDRVDLVKSDDGWAVVAGKKTYNADRQFISTIIAQFKLLKPERVVSTTRDRWKEFEVDDSSCTRLTLYEGDEVLADLVIGKFNFKQSQNPYMNQNAITSFVRLVGEDDVYAVNGMLSLMFMRGVDDYRDKTVLPVRASDLSRLTFTYPGDSSFVLERRPAGWVVDGVDADTTKVSNYLNQLAGVTGYDFVDETPAAGKTRLYSVKVERGAGEAVEVVAYAADTTNGTIIESSANKGSLFSGKKTGITSRLFLGKRDFLK